MVHAHCSLKTSSSNTHLLAEEPTVGVLMAQAFLMLVALLLIALTLGVVVFLLA